MTRCKFFGHKLKPVFIKGYYGNKKLKFIGAYCKRCGKGRKELHEAINLQDIKVYNTYNEKYFDE